MVEDDVVRWCVQMKRANKSKNNSIGALLGVNVHTGKGAPVLITGCNRMTRRMQKKGKKGV